MSLAEDWEQATELNAPPPYEGNQFVDEPQFKDWYSRWATTAGLDQNPDDPQHHYDYRAAFAAGVEPSWVEDLGQYKWPSQFKKDSHPNLIVDGVNTKTGEPVPPSFEEEQAKPIEQQWDEGVTPDTIVTPPKDTSTVGPSSHELAPPEEGMTASGFLGGLGSLLRRTPSLVTDMIPETLGRSWRAGRKSTEETFLDRWIEDNRLEGEKSKKLTPEEKGKLFFTMPFTGQRVTWGDAEESAENLAYSVANIIATWGAATAGGVQGGLVASKFSKDPRTIAAGATIGAATAGFVAGSVFSGDVTKDQFIDQFYQSFRQAFPEKTPENEARWKKVYKMIETDADWYGFWEAAPETLGNLLTGGIAGLGKGLFAKPAMAQFKKEMAKNVGLSIASKLGIPVAKAAAMLTEEMMTEIWTQIKQSEIEAKYGLREKPADFAQAFLEVAPQVVINTAVMGGLASAGTSVAGKFKQAQDEKKLAPMIDSWLSGLEQGYQDGAVSEADLKEIQKQIKGSNRIKAGIQGIIDGSGIKLEEMTDDEILGGEGGPGVQPAPPTEPPASIVGFEPASDTDIANLKGYLGSHRAEEDIIVSAAAPTPENAQVQRVAKAMGLRAVFFAGEGVSDTVNGAYEPDSGTIFINANSEKPLLTILGHETVHRLHTEHADLYSKLEEVTHGMTEDFDKYVSTINKARKARGFTELDPSKKGVKNEFMADFVGQQFANPEFWKKVDAHDPALGKQVARIVYNMIEKIKTTLRGQKVADAKYFKNLNEVQDAVAATYAEFARREKKVVDTTKAAERTIQRNKDGSATVKDASGKAVTVFGPEYAKGKSDAEILAAFDKPKNKPTAPTAKDFTEGAPVTGTEAQEPAKEPPAPKAEGKKPTTKKEKARADLQTFIDGLTDEEFKSMDPDIWAEKEDAPAQTLLKMQRALAEYRKAKGIKEPQAKTPPPGKVEQTEKQIEAPAPTPEPQTSGIDEKQKGFVRKKVQELGREKALKLYDTNGTIDTYARTVIDELFPAKVQQPETKPAPKEGESKVSTLRGRIKAMGGIRVGNFAGEFKDAPTAVKYLLNRDGTSFDLAEQTLKDEGWLGANENLVDVLRDPANLRRNKVAGEGVEKRPENMTDQEKEAKAALEHEPEAPPEGTYIEIAAEDLPKDKKLAIIDGVGEGWDFYEVMEKDAFGVTLKDGRTLELKPGDKVQVRKEDLGKAETKPAEPQKEPWQMTKAEYLKVADRSKPFQGTDAFVLGYHQESVFQAIKKGENVPAEVLAEYPDLVKEFAEAKPAEPETKPAEPETPEAPAPNPREDYIAEQRSKPDRMEKLEIEVPAIDKDGNVYMVKQDAQTAVNESDKQMDFARRLMECLNS